jgi:hypothetical protein
VTLWSHPEVRAGGTTRIWIDFGAGLVQEAQVHTFDGLYWDLGGPPRTWEITRDALIGRNDTEDPVLAIAGGLDWKDYVVELRFRVVRGGFHFRCRGQFLPVGEGWDFDGTPPFGPKLDRESWYRIRAEVTRDRLRWIWLDERRRQSFNTDNPTGPFALEVLPGSEVHFRQFRIER